GGPGERAGADARPRVRLGDVSRPRYAAGADPGERPEAPDTRDPRPLQQRLALVPPRWDTHARGSRSVLRQPAACDPRLLARPRRREVRRRRLGDSTAPGGGTRRSPHARRRAIGGTFENEFTSGTCALATDAPES